ncbi:MAG: altronate dehydratase family protein [Prevotellaceae bacterium]|jgi:altronate hydrolase|nr:altronate dehydratase family protein [Prevotellaceae bacterium]
MKFIKINPVDNVAVALENLQKGEAFIIDNQPVALQENISAGHKFALKNLVQNENIIKYGFPIGHTISEIVQGGWVNENNLKTNLKGVEEYKFEPIKHYKLKIKNETRRTFKGFRRKNGEVGIRNDIWIIPTVGCINGTVGKLASDFRNEVGGESEISVVAFPHNYGCSQLGDDHENTRKILADMVLHPNAAGILVVGLGCENNQISKFKEILVNFNETRIKFLETQKVDNEYEAGIELLREIYAEVKDEKRTEIPISELKIGLKCGGSDGFSGITANPLLGAFSDWLIVQGGSAVLTEVPEMFGAETILMNRCVDIETFNKTVHLINNFKEYFTKNEQPIYENPSPGNKAGGISTLEEKSLGCTQKSGKSPIQDVLQYGDRLKISGLSLLSAPGNDLVASTALAAAGCHLVLFTTGRGTPFGTFVPTMKIATNTPLFEKKTHWIDFNAGVIVENQTINQVNEKFIDFVIDIASGKLTNNEKSNFREIAIFKTGVTL